MSFLADSSIKGPVDVAGGAYRFVRRVKVFSANSAGALETAINDWLLTLEASTTEYVVGDVATSTPSNNNTLAVVSYGYFVPA